MPAVIYENSTWDAVVRRSRVAQGVPPSFRVNDPTAYTLPEVLPALYLKSEIIGVNTSCGVTGGSTFTLRIRSHHDLLAESGHDTIQVNDWVEIFATSRGERRRIFVGWVDDVVRSSGTSSAGSEDVSYLVTGSGWEKAILTQEIVFDAQLGALVNAALMIEDAIKLAFSFGIGASPVFTSTQLVNSLISKYTRGTAGNNGQIRQFMVPVNNRLTPIGYLIDFNDINTWKYFDPRQRTNAINYACVFNPQGTGQLGSLLQRYSNPLINELWFDHDLSPLSSIGSFTGFTPPPLKVYLRERPFSKANFNDLDFYKFDESSHYSLSIGQSSRDIRNWFRVHPDGITPDFSVAANIGVIVPGSINRHGFRRMEPQTEFFFAANSMSTGIPSQPLPMVTAIKEYTKKIAEWYWQNHKLYTGTITLPLSTNIRPGRGLEITDSTSLIRYRFYIDRVSHQLNYPGRGTTTVNVSRGVRVDRTGSAKTLLSFRELSNPRTGYLVPFSIDESSLPFTPNPAGGGELVPEVPEYDSNVGVHDVPPPPGGDLSATVPPGTEIEDFRD